MKYLNKRGPIGNSETGVRREWLVDSRKQQFQSFHKYDNSCSSVPDIEFQ
jgi:hypothetical protein